MKLSLITTLLVMAGLLASPVSARQDKDQSLPPGLQKKAAKGQGLPPGWEKKLSKGAIMDKEVYQQSKIVVPVDSKGLVTVSIEGKLVRLHQLTHEIVDILK